MGHRSIPLCRSDTRDGTWGGCMTYRVVWFKRDLRLQDHAALLHAARQGPLLCLYIVEPELWAQPDAALQHFEFVRESLAELHADLQALGGALHLRVGSAVQVLAALHQQAPFAELVSHMETGNAFNAETANRLRNNIYSVGGSVDPEDAYKAFRGKLPSAEAMLKKKGLAA